MLLFTHENKRNFVTQFCLRYHLCNHVARLLDQADSIGQKRLYLVLSCCFNNIIHLYMDLSFCLFIIPSISLSVFLSFCLSVFLSFCLSVFQSFCLFVFLSFSLSVFYLFIFDGHRSSTIDIFVFSSFCLSFFLPLCLLFGYLWWS